MVKGSRRAGGQVVRRIVQHVTFAHTGIFPEARTLGRDEAFREAHMRELVSEVCA